MENKGGSLVSLKASGVELEKTETKNEEEEIIAPALHVWSSRVKNVLAYICGVANFQGILLLCTAAGEFGATTLVPHLLSRIFVGTPIALIEIMLGRYITGNSSRISKMCPLSYGVFLCLMLNTTMISVWNNVFIVYTLKYLIALFQGNLPWAECQKTWSEPSCYKIASKLSPEEQCIQRYPKSRCENLTWEVSENQYWRRIIGNPLHYPGYNILYLIIVVVLIVLINCKGIRSLEKVLSLFIIITFLLCSIFVFGSFHTPGEVKGLMSIWFFDSSLLAEPKIWIISFENCLLSIRVGELILSFVSSHGRIVDDIFLDLLVAILTEVFYFVILAVPLSGIIWFANARYADLKKQPLFQDHLDTFISISAALSEYPKPVLFWAGLFYAQTVWQSLGNQAVLVMALGDAIYGLFDLETVFSQYFYFVCILGVGLFVLSVPAMFIPFNDVYPFSASILTTVFFFLFTLIAFYGSRRFKADFHFLLGYPAPMFFRFFWVSSIPILFIMLTLKMVFRIPKRQVPYIVYIFIGIPTLIYLLGAVVAISRASRKKNIMSAFVANPNWAPQDPLLKTSRVIFDSVSATKEFLYRQELYTKLFEKPIDFSNQNIVRVN